MSSSSSETSRSDSSSRLTLWPEPFRYATPSEPSASLLEATALKLLGPSSEGSLYGAMMGGLRPPSKPPLPRGLHEAGRQSSTDSGIATASRSSYSGSFSSCTGSLDTGHGEADEFGSLFSLVSNLNPNPSAQSRPLPQFQNIHPISSAPSTTSLESRPVCVCAVTGETLEQDSEYQVPGHILQHYDAPRRLLQPHPSGAPAALDLRPHPGALEPPETPAPRPTGSMRSSGSTEGIESPGNSTAPRHFICPSCGGLKVCSYRQFTFIGLID